jgi:RNA polymerase sigma factor (sigma-70 family)
VTVLSIKADRAGKQPGGQLAEVFDKGNSGQVASGGAFDAAGPLDRQDRTTISEDSHARFRKHVLPYLGDAFSLARWITGNRADAEDVVQDACVRAFRAIGSVTDGKSRAWVLTIVRNAAYTWLRKNRPAAVLMVEDLEAIESAGSFAAHDGETPEAALIAKADAAILEAAIATLPAIYRETLVLRDVHGLGYREIAEVTNVPIGTVMSRLARGRERVIKTTGRRA